MIIKQFVNHHQCNGADSQSFIIKVPTRGTIHRFQIAQVSANPAGFTWALYNYRGAVGNLSRLVHKDTESSSWSVAGTSLGTEAVGNLENAPRHFFRLLHGVVGASAYDDANAAEDDWLTIPVPYQNLDGTGPSSRMPHLYLEINPIDNDPTVYMSSLIISGVDP